MEENYKLIDLKCATSKNGKVYYYCVIYISSDYVAESMKVFLSEEGYNYLIRMQNQGVEVDVSKCFKYHFNNEKKAFELMFDNTLL